MANRNTLKGGTDFTEEGLKPSDLNDTYDAFYRKVYADTEGSVTSSSSETTIATTTISQNDLGSSASAIINASIHIFVDDNQNRFTTFRLKVGGSTVQTIILESQSAASTTDSGIGGAFVYFATGLDSTAGDITIEITAQNNSAASVHVATCYGLIVDAVNNNG